MTGRWLAVAATAAVLAAIAAALVLVGGPWTARQQRLDERRLADLNALAGQIEDYRSVRGRLPADVTELDRIIPGESPARDPASGTPYLYEPLDDDRYRLCATLARPDDAVGREPLARLLRREMTLVPITGADGRFCLETVRQAATD